MPLDAACLTGIVQECRPAVEGARVDKIFQPARDEIVMLLRGNQGNCKLLLTANPSHPRLQLTEGSRENPANPPMFCMLLRKYLSGAQGHGSACSRLWSGWWIWSWRPPTRWGTRCPVI